MSRCGALWATMAAALPLVAASPRPPDAAEQLADLAAIRTSAFNYAKRLPDLSCDLVSRQSVMGLPGNPTDVSGIIEETFTVAGGEESYQPTKINDKLAADSHRPTFDPLPWKEFVTVLQGIFDPHTDTNFHWDRWVQRERHWLWGSPSLCRDPMVTPSSDPNVPLSSAIKD